MESLRGSIQHKLQPFERGQTALLFASINGHLSTVKELVKRGANTEIKDGVSSLMFFCFKLETDGK